MKTLLITTLVAILPQVAFAQFAEGKSAVKASNGVTVSVSADTFANRHHFSSPKISTESIKKASAGTYVAKSNHGATKGDVFIYGWIVYGSKSWRYYKSALLRGGESVDYTRTGGEVSSCPSLCVFSEDFVIDITSEQREKYTINGNLEFQIRSENEGDKIIVSVPAEYFDAVNEVGK